ncbi:MAG: rhodanese-like domain-containing protein [Opitutaceae bacterium]
MRCDIHWRSLLALSLLFVAAFGRGYAEDVHDAYLIAEPGITNVGQFDLAQEIWVGPLRFQSMDTDVDVSDIRVSSKDLTVLNSPETIEAGTECELEVAFTPKALGLQTIVVELRTSEGTFKSVFRAIVVSENPLRALAMTLPISVKPTNRIAASVLLTDIRERPNDWTRMLIDVRPKSRYDQRHAIGAQFIHLHELLFRPELKNNRIYLIDDGAYEQPNLLKAKRLEQAGFESVYWVDGGLPEWIRAGGELSAPVTQDSALDYGAEAWRVLRPLQLYYSAIRPEMHLIFSGSAEAQQQAEALFPDQPLYRWDSSTTLDQITEQVTAETPILVVGTGATGFLNLVGSLADADYHQVYTINGGLDGMITYLESKQAKDSKFRTYSVQAGARNPKGKTPPKLKSESDCLTCD